MGNALRPRTMLIHNGRGMSRGGLPCVRNCQGDNLNAQRRKDGIDNDPEPVELGEQRRNSAADMTDDGLSIS